MVRVLSVKTSEDAKKLGELMERIGTFAGKKCKAVITDMNTPLGSNIGNALEVKETVVARLYYVIKTNGGYFATA